MTTEHVSPAPRLFAIAIAILTALAPVRAPAAEQTTIRIASEGGHPPFNFVDATGQLQGFEIDLAHAVCERLKAKCHFIAHDFTGLLPGLVAGRYDAVFSSLTITEERRRFVAFSERYYSTRAMFVTSRAKPVRSVKPEDLKGKVIGAKLGSTNAKILQDVYATAGAEIKLYVTHDEARLDLSRGRVDALIGDKTALVDWLEKSPIAACCEIVGDDVELPSTYSTGIGAAVRKSDGGLKARIDGAIEMLRADGGYDQIRRKYFSFDPY
jgi:polar amino acid transport system substrate-binding protein